MRHADDPTPLICSASWEGQITQSQDGQGGFGYDPVFYVPDLNCTSAQLTKQQKNAVSPSRNSIKTVTVRA